jgi:hypothetical protein
MRCARLSLAVSVIVCLAGCSSAKTSTNSSSSHPSVTSTTSPAVLSDREVLRRVSWQAGDLRASFRPALLGDGDQVVNQVTLDLCGATFPSEQRRRARHQVGAGDARGRDTTGMSIEAVLYDAPAGARQAMREVRAAQERCPHGYVRSDVAGVSPLQYRFAPAPDKAWSNVNGVDRFVVAATVNDQHGRTEREQAVYQQRGRLLVAFYTSDPKATAAALSRPVRVFVEVLARRMAALPATAVQ